MELDLVQVTQLIGAALILLAYVAHQLHRMNPGGVLYNVLNLIGGMLLGYAAVVELQYGFIVLELVWSLVSLVALTRLYRRHTPAAGEPLDQAGAMVIDRRDAGEDQHRAS